MKRSEVKQAYKWDLDSVMKGEEWESTFADLSQKKNSLDRYRGKLAEKAALLSCLREESKISLCMENLYVYAKMKQDEDTALASSQSMVGRARNLAAELSAASSFINPEIISSYSEEALLALSEEAEFADYSYLLQELARNRKRFLSEKEPDELDYIKTGVRKYEQTDTADVEVD